MHADEVIELEEQYNFGKSRKEEEYEKEFPFINESGTGTTSVIEEDPNSENMRNIFENNNDTEGNNNINNNNNIVNAQIVIDNDNVNIIYQEHEEYFNLYEEPQRDNLLRLE